MFEFGLKSTDWYYSIIIWKIDATQVPGLIHQQLIDGYHSILIVFDFWHWYPNLLHQCFMHVLYCQQQRTLSHHLKLCQCVPSVLLACLIQRDAWKTNITNQCMLEILTDKSRFSHGSVQHFEYRKSYWRGTYLMKSI